MSEDIEIWSPGSFTKNFSWGATAKGLTELHTVIRVGFEGSDSPVLRNEFRARVYTLNKPDYIPLNFFLYNFRRMGSDFVAHDELVFQARNFNPSKDFDRLALFALVLSIVGRWTGARTDQARPAMWANAYVRERLGGALDWDASKLSADDIEEFIKTDPRYTGKTTRKLATNFYSILKSGDIKSFKSKNVTRWWVNALFLTLDRLILRREAQGLSTKPEQYPQLLASIGFLSLSGPRSVEKELAQIHITKLYELCGGVSRFSTDHVRALVNVRLPDIQNYIENDHRLGAAIHYSNPSILKTIPRACALLAKHAGFDFIDADDLENFNVDDFVKEKVKDALAKLKQRGTHPTMTAADLMKLTRDQ